ncbi:Inosine/uridine-preferring nucleoside hydrolase [Penicillium brevicompactum]|uniref:Inosine/uridine-preferring nucleoside hydrolase n=1 Tax=Penicillium brevicompactum TaxID=5074 RepID=UPI00253FEA7B|nr:Inosine/uridine-preferring nucleoside hydrolase [Penicillium brevicompactum]KAJ5332415.1 Inosine/uridine-preferring nucleoside hydrolase [Penicillium brevicompactum]
MGKKIIIDTDPGIDDVLALLLALSATPEEVEVLLISLTFGNIEVKNCLRNAVSMFHILEREMQWRRDNGRPEGFGSLRAHRPVLAVGAEDPLEDQKMLADYFHGTDGLGGIHATHPHLTATKEWEHLFTPTLDSEGIEPVADCTGPNDHAFVSSKVPAHKEILRALRENEPDSVTLVAVGPLTNLALAAAEDPETFLRVKEVVVMGGAINEPGNVTPMGEFNAYADAVAAARIFALTSPNPHTTIPITKSDLLPPYPAKLSRQLTLRLFPLDITLRHNLSKGQFRKSIAPLLEGGSPLAEWVDAFMGHTFKTLERLHPGHVGDDAELSLHDPVCVWYAITSDDPKWVYAPNSPEDIRIDSLGQWTRGMCVIDRRNRHRIEGDEESSSDHGLWLSGRAGNRIWRMDGSPAEGNFGDVIIQRLFN